MGKLYSVRYDFPMNCVVCNADSKNEFRASIADFYFGTLEEAISHSIVNGALCSAYAGAPAEVIRLEGIKKYTKIISCLADKTGVWHIILRKIITVNQ